MKQRYIGVGGTYTFTSLPGQVHLQLVQGRITVYHVDMFLGGRGGNVVQLGPPHGAAHSDCKHLDPLVGKKGIPQREYEKVLVFRSVAWMPGADSGFFNQQKRGAGGDPILGDQC